jgi:protein phosphatase
MSTIFEPIPESGENRILHIPECALILLIGPSGAGKSTFARRHFEPSEIVSSDVCRGLVCDNEDSMEATRDAFQLVHMITRKRMSRQKLTVIDATNVERRARRPLLQMARTFGADVIGLVFEFPESVYMERNRMREGRFVAEDVVRMQIADLKRSIPELYSESFAALHLFGSTEDADEVEFERVTKLT